VDYIRVPGREWVPDPTNRYETVEILDPLLRAIPRVINQIMDDLPKAFHLAAGEERRRDIPLLPSEVVREVVVNAVMHRSYRVRGSVQIIRYSNRLEIRNPGISLVPDDRLGEPGSITRNEKIAAILHETQYAETKGTGIRAVRELMKRFDLAPPFFESDREKDIFTAYLLFHHLLSPDDLAWLNGFREYELSPEDQKALVYVREIGAINNALYRTINGVETLVASAHLRRLRDQGLLLPKGQGRAAYYVPAPAFFEGVSSEPGPLSSEQPPLSSKPGALSSEAESLPKEITTMINRCRSRRKSLQLSSDVKRRPICSLQTSRLRLPKCERGRTIALFGIT
jgi:ATP-dependent DNA helicase RecG